MTDREPIIEEHIAIEPTPMLPTTFDLLMQDGWRLLGGIFLRHNVTVWQGRQVRTVPLRVRLGNFQLSKSQRKILRRNADLQLFFGQPPVDEERRELFARHTKRFPENRPATLATFFDDPNYELPVHGSEFSIFENDKLVAVSYLHLGDRAANATYAFFDPGASRSRSLGTYTMLLEMLYAQETGREFYYLGYTYELPSPMDYKKQFHGLEIMNWDTGLWRPEPRTC